MFLIMTSKNWNLKDCRNDTPYHAQYVHNYMNKSIQLKYEEMFDQFHTMRMTNSDIQLVRKNMDVNEHIMLSNITLRHILK